MSKLYSITSRKLTKNDFKKALRESKTENLGRDSAMLINDFPMYTAKIMQAVGEVMVERI